MTERLTQRPLSASTAPLPRSTPRRPRGGLGTFFFSKCDEGVRQAIRRPPGEATARVGETARRCRRDDLPTFDHFSECAYARRRWLSLSSLPMPPRYTSCSTRRRTLAACLSQPRTSCWSGPDASAQACSEHFRPDSRNGGRGRCVRCRRLVTGTGGLRFDGYLVDLRLLRGGACWSLFLSRRGIGRADVGVGSRRRGGPGGSRAACRTGPTRCSRRSRATGTR